ncbi:helix-turn-helix transcriptional regulator [Paraburkholderia megapolitana]|jgi:predicted DNA-binding transcriptional regulator YafY|uniref:helix-turn-helix transcriptional regulator n=1 Tax=Paraburkholderia megapolitana TaxID=420953 RepID=UPI0038BDB094
MSRSHRLFDLMQILRRHHLPVPGTQLAREADVSLRTIRRDIASLQAIGADIEGEPGVGYVLKPGFLLPPLMFTEEELHALMLGAQWVRQQTDGNLASAAQNLLAKIEAVLPSELQRQLYDDPFYVSDQQSPPDVIDLATLRQAIREQKKLTISYRDVNDADTGRTIWPFLLGFDGPKRYLAAWCELRQDFRVFRTDRIQHAELLSDRYPGRRRDLYKRWRSQVEKAEGLQSG